MIKVTTAAAVLFFSSQAFAAPSYLRPLERELKAAQFDLVYPLDDSVIVGAVYQKMYTSNHTPFDRLVCQNLFSSFPVNSPSHVQLASRLTVRKNDGSFGATIAPQVFAGNADVAGTLERTGTNSATIEFTNVQKRQIPGVSDGPTGSRSISAACSSSLRKYFSPNVNGQPGVIKRGVQLRYVVQTLSIGGVKYSYAVDSALKAGFGAKLKSIVDVKFKHNITHNDQTSLVVSQADGLPRYVIGWTRLAIDNAAIDENVAAGDKASFTLSKASD